MVNKQKKKWNEILRSPLAYEDPHLTKLLMEIKHSTNIQHLREEVSKGKIPSELLVGAIKDDDVEEAFAPTVGYLEERFPGILELVFEKGYVTSLLAAPGCPPETDGVILTEKGKKYVENVTQAISKFKHSSQRRTSRSR